jgi:hypothetical protein
MATLGVVEGDRIAKLIEALAKEGPSEPAVVEKPTIEEEPEFSEAELERVLRRTLVFERRSRGDTVEEICTFLHSKGYPASRRTVFYDLRSEEICTLIDELVRVQFRDIALLRGYALQDTKTPDLKALAAAITARGLMINCLKPKLETPVKVEVDVKTCNENTILLREYSDILREASAINTSISAVRVGEQVDS